MRFLSLFAFGCFFIGSQAYAESSDSDVALEIQINQRVFTFTSDESKVTAAGKSQTSKSDSYETMPNALEVDVAVGSFHVYLFPTDSEASMGFGYQIADTMELGLMLGYDKVDTQNGGSINNSIYGLYFEQAFELPSYTLEYEVVAAVSELEQEIKANSGGSTNSKVKGNSFAIETRYIRPLAGGFSYVCLLGAHMHITDHDSLDIKTETVSYSFSPLAVRFDF